MHRLLFIAPLLLATLAHADEDAAPPATLRVGDADVMRLGSGVRVKWFFSQYRLTLYVHQTQAQRDDTKDLSADALAARLLAVPADQPIGLRLEIVASSISVDRMRSSMNEGFERSLEHVDWPDDLDVDAITKRKTHLRASFEQFSQVFTQRDAKRGEVFLITCHPTHGCKAWREGDPDNARTIPADNANAAFPAALLGIWLCKGPTTGKTLKHQLLGRAD